MEPLGGGGVELCSVLGVGGVIVGQQKELGGRLAEDVTSGATGAAPECARPAEGCAKVKKAGAVPPRVQIISSVSWNQKR